jgi:Uma2 family endonuclease
MATSQTNTSVRQPPYPVRTFTVDEYHRLGQSGVLSEKDDVELLEGWIVPKMIRNPIHDVVVGLVDAAIRSRIPEGWVIRNQSAITTADSEPEPDVAVVRGPIRRYTTHHPLPDDVALVVEVADTSLERDRQKAKVYARAGIPAYWIVNLVDSQIEMYSHLAPSEAHNRYANRRPLSPQDEAALIIEGRQIATIRVSELLP